jgi:3-hydroxyisobutyrate dehydrogenase
MLPVGANVRAVMLEDGVLAGASPGTLLIDSSTIDVKNVKIINNIQHFR